jgi:maleate isomerase
LFALQTLKAKKIAMATPYTDFRTVEIIEILERELKCPVVTSNQASFWCALRNCGINDNLKGFGQLFKY